MQNVRRLVGWVSFWLATFWLWLLLVGEWNRIELIAAAAAATIAATIGELARARAEVRVRVPLAWVASAKTVPLTIFVDFAIIVWALARSAARREVVRGAFRTRELPIGGDDPAAAGIRAWVAVMATYSPNAYVVDLDAERARSFVHDLVPRRSSEKPA